MTHWLDIPRSSWIGGAALAAILGLLAVAVLLLLGDSGNNIATLVLMQVAAVVALAVYTGNSGIVSFGHAAFMGLGAYVSGILTMDAATQATALPNLPAFLAHYELSPAVAMIVVALAAIIVGLASGIPMSRLSTGSAAIGSLAILIILHVCLVGARDITRGSQTFYGVPTSTTFAVALGLALAIVIFARVFKESRWGLVLRASRDNEIAASAMGVRVGHQRLIGWVVSIILVSLVGALYGHFLGAFSPKDFYFNLTFTLIAMLIVGGMMSVTGAVAGAVLVAAVIQVLRLAETGIDFGAFKVPGIFGLPQLGMGLALILTIWKRPAGLVGLAEFGFQKIQPAPELTKPLPIERKEQKQLTGRQLSVEAISMRFGGLQALEDISFKVAAGKITGLIGPNGAGKTTLINIICGQLAPTSGQVKIDDAALTGRKPHAIAVAGLGRTFQNIRLFERLTALENVKVAALSKGISAQQAELQAHVQLKRLGLDHRASHLAGSFAYGDRRRLEIARALALDPAFLLLDEPAAGMNPAETSRLIEVLEKIQSELGLGLLLVEHDLRLIMSLCDNIVVVNKGQKIAEGTPHEIQQNPAVIEAYIGKKRSIHK